MAEEREDSVTASEETATPSEEAGAAEEATGAPTSSEATAQSAPAEVLSPKRRRQRARAAKAAQAPTQPQRSPEERQAERVDERRRKAQLRSVRRKREREKARAGRAAALSAEAAAAQREHHPGKQKTRQGVVVSDRAAKTIVVRIDVTRRHPRYEKIVRTSTTLHAHDEREDAHIGDTVVVRESRPVSRTKRWRLVEVLERAR